jgi:hypothetical protein
MYSTIIYDMIVEFGTRDEERPALIADKSAEKFMSIIGPFKVGLEAVDGSRLLPVPGAHGPGAIAVKIRAVRRTRP